MYFLLFRIVFPIIGVAMVDAGANGLRVAKEAYGKAAMSLCNKKQSGRWGI